MIHFHAQYLKGIETQLLYNDLMYNALHFNIFSTMQVQQTKNVIFGNVENLIVSG